MPVHAYINDRRLAEKGLQNYWGYNTLGFFAPEMRYSCSEKVKEFKMMVKTLHSAGIEVILDVVYNHTCEGNELGPTLSLRGIDNASYYMLRSDNPRFYADYTGCGNTVNLEHPSVLQMVMDSLRYWVEEMHVDGFRFDLASALARESGQVEHLGGFFDVIRQDPALNRVKLIAEPWDLGHGGYQVGNFPLGWAEWNDRYRDGMRAYWKGDGGVIGEFARRITGSSDLYGRSGKRPHASINFVTAHDGFTLHDLVSYNEKHNEANGEDNQDGNNNNLSWNCGAEGPTDDPQILALRQRQKRNFLATLLLSQGVPMMVMGDEYWPHAAGQQQRLLPGQRDQLVRLDTHARARGAARLREEAPRSAPLAPDLPAAGLLRRPRAARQPAQGPALAQARRPGDEHRRMGARIRALPRHVPGGRGHRRGRQARAADRRRRLPRALQRPPRGHALRHPRHRAAMPWNALIDTYQASGIAGPKRYERGGTYPLRGRSLALLTRPPAAP